MTEHKKPKERLCKNCRGKFLQWNSIVVWCSPKCGVELAATRRAQKYKKQTLEMRREYRKHDRPYQMRKAQDTFNKFIRLRDGNKCISCGSTTRQIHSGHYLSCGGHPELRFHPFNASSQCSLCNNWKSGNQKDYRIGLIQKIGLSNVEWLEGPHQSANLTLDDIKSINKWYKEQIKHL